MLKKIIIRCDAGEISELGTGHLYRSITLYNLLRKKFSLKKKDILFITKNYGKYKIAEKILREKKVNFYPVKKKFLDYSKEEANIINQFNSNLIIIDRWGKIKKKFIIKLKKNHKKIILIDDGSNFRNLVNLSINPLKIFVNKAKNGFIGHKYNILPSIEKKITKKINKNNKEILIFMSFGGFDKKNLTKKTMNHLSKNNLNCKYLINNKYRHLIKNDTGIVFFKSKDYYNNLSKADLVISAGGLSMFDAIYFKKKTICIPQYKHQLKNINILDKKKIIYKVDPKNLSKLSYLVLNFLNKKNKYGNIKNTQNEIINLNIMKKTLNLIYKNYEK